MSETPAPSESPEPAPPDLAAELYRWGLRADALSGVARERGARAEDALRGALLLLRRAIEQAQATTPPIDPGDEATERMEEASREAGEAASRADLLALNVLVEAARMGEDDHGLEQIAQEIRALTGRSSRGSQEVEDLASRLRRGLHEARQLWGETLRKLDGVAGGIDEALRLTAEAGHALSEASEASAQFAAGTRVNTTQRAWSSTEQEAATRLAAAAEVRGESLNVLAEAVRKRLEAVVGSLDAHLSAAQDAEARIAAFEGHLQEHARLLQATTEIARRAKQLAINADLAALRVRDPAFELFSDEARRLGERAEATAAATTDLLEGASRVHEPSRDAVRRIAEGLAVLSQQLQGVLAGTGTGDVDPGGLTHALRADRSAARQLARAQAEWRSESEARTDEPEA
ncbi:MAG: methyl-accepting chemotaxis protein [Planctomycetota bacterium]